MDESEPSPPRNRDRLERWCCAALVLLGLALRVAQLPQPFDRQFDGFQGAFFAVAAVDYERLAPEGHDGLLPAGVGGGYPAVNLDIDPSRPEDFYVYANHPPLVPWMAWAAIRAAAPSDWRQRTGAGLAPRGFEAPARAPFLAAHLASLAVFWLALRRAGCKRAANLALAALALMPSALLYAGLVNYEQPTLLAAGLQAVGATSYARDGRRRWLLLVGAGGLLGGLVTYFPLFFGAALGLVGWSRGWRCALAIKGVAVGSGLVTLAVHARRSATLLEARGDDSGALAERVLTLVGPLFDGSIPLGHWLSVQGGLLEREVGLVFCALAVLGLIVALRRGLARDAIALLALALVVAGLGIQLAFYRHTADPQDPFLVHLLPGLAACVGLALVTVSTRLEGSAGQAAVVVALLAGSGEAAWRSSELHALWRGPARVDEAPLIAPPETLGALVAEMTPPGACVWTAAELGLGLAYGYYAWRTILPIPPGQYALPQLQQNNLGLEDAPTYLLAPDVPPAPFADAVERIWRDLEEARPGTIAAPEASRQGWSVWRLR